MSPPQDEGPFFIGWAAPDRRLWPFLTAVFVAVFVASFGISYLVAATQDDPGDGGRTAPAMARGILEAAPYPVLHVLESNRFEVGETILLMGMGKNGVQGRVNPLDGQMVIASGFRLARGELQGMILRGGGNGLAMFEGEGEVPEAEDLGRWRLTGEICDGNCLAGAMRPGRGLAHRACANLCILGGLPPVFVATDEVGGSEFFLVGGPDGGPLPEDMLDFTAILIAADGRVERRGDMNVFLIEPDSVEVVR